MMSGRTSTKQACIKHWDHKSQDYVLRDTIPSKNMITILDRWIVYKVLCCHRSRDCRMAHLFSSDNLIPTYHILYIMKFQLGEMEIDIWVLREYECFGNLMCAQFTIKKFRHNFQISCMFDQISVSFGAVCACNMSIL